MLVHNARVCEDSVLNLTGQIVNIGPPPLVAVDNPQLPRRSLVLRHGDYEFEVILLASAAKAAFASGDKVAFFGIRKCLYQGVVSLETGRLSWFLCNPSWLQLPDFEGRPRKALKVEALVPTSVSSLHAIGVQETAARLVVACVMPLTEAVFGQQIFVSDKKIRVEVVLRDSTGNQAVMLWTEQLS